MARRSRLLSLACWSLVVGSIVMIAPDLRAEDSAWVREEFSRRLGRGISSLNAGDARSAVKDLCWSARRGLNSARANLLCGRALVAARQATKASSHLELATELEPKNLGAWVSLGDAYLASGRVDRARGAFHKALELRSDHSPAYDGLARLAEQIGNEDSALEYFNKALEANPTDARARLHRGQLHIRARRFDQALDDIREAARLRPDDAEAHLGFSRILLINALPNQALAAARKAANLQPLSARIPAHVARIYYSLGAYGEAEQMVRLALERDPDLVDARMVLAEILGRTRRIDEAIATLEPHDPELLREGELEQLRLSAEAWTQRREKIASMNTVVETGQASAEQLLSLAEALLRTGEGADAVALAAQATQAGPQQAPILRRAAAIYFRADRPLEASELLGRVESLGQATPVDLANLGVALELTGAPDLAAAAYRRSLAGDSPPAAANGGLARLAFVRGDKEETIEKIVAFLASNPASEDAVRATEALHRLSGTKPDDSPGEPADQPPGEENEEGGQ